MSIIATLDRFEEDKAVLILDSGEKIIWPRTKLPAKTREGDVFYIDIKTEAEARSEREKQAKDILNELLKIDSN